MVSDRSIDINTNYRERKQLLDDKLSSIEKSFNKHKNHEDSYVPKIKDLIINSHNTNRIKGFKGKQSIFKRPDIPAPRKHLRTIPDYHRNPEKWAHYSLEDVEDVTDESNRQAAFSFLKELEQRKKRESKQNKIKEKLKLHETAMEVDEKEETKFDLDEKNKSSISFCKPQKKQESNVKQMKPEFRNNKFVMPEYEFGTKKIVKKKNQNNTTQKINKTKEMKLDHLLMNEDEED